MTNSEAVVRGNGRPAWNSATHMPMEELSRTVKE
jgi:hypothetical protein